MALLIANGPIITVDPALPRADWLVVEGSRIAGLGLGESPHVAETYDLDGGS